MGSSDTQSKGTNMAAAFRQEGYFAEKIGQVNEETIKKYIKEKEEYSRIKR